LFAMAFVGNLVGRVDNRLLVTFGVLMNIAALWVLQHLYLGVDFWHVTASRLLQGFGMGFLFVPLTAVAFAGLRPEQMGQATGLFNLLRNEGGSVGIAISSTILARHSQLHHLRLAENLTPGNPVLQERVAAMAHGLGAATGVDPATAQQLAWRVVSLQTQVQARVVAYDDVFWMLTLAFICFLPFILFLGGKVKVVPSRLFPGPRR
jgi:MFS transporter, DHA2 family, multidrug resistance protein